MRFTDKTVIITGASAGIGAAAARLFALEGARVVLAARGKDALEDTAREIGQINQGSGDSAVLAVPTDVADPDSGRALLERAEREFGTVDVLVNNAGRTRRGPVEACDADELGQIVDVNLRAPVMLSRLVLPYLRKAGGGAIVNVASIAGRIPLADEAVYSATKFGLRAFTFALAEELAGSGIKVSAVSPGPVDTGFIMESLDDVPDVVFSQPMSTAEDIAALILDCAADGRRERVLPRSSGYLATLGYLLPPLIRRIQPIMERRGRKIKERYRQRAHASAHASTDAPAHASEE